VMSGDPEVIVQLRSPQSERVQPPDTKTWALSPGHRPTEPSPIEQVSGSQTPSIHRPLVHGVQSGLCG
jgi:hypothetical protein